MWGSAKNAVMSAKGKDKKSSESLVGGSHPPTASTVTDADNVHEDADKNKKKGAPGTPDKSTSPGPGAPVRDVVINSKEIQLLAIKDEDLAKLRQSLQNPKTESNIEVSKSVYNVKKVKPHEPHSAQQTRRVVVARPAPPNAPLKTIDYSGPNGPRYDANNQIIPYSLLGSVHDFVDEAVKRNDIRPDSPAAQGLSISDDKLQIKTYDRPRTAYQKVIPMAMNQGNALLNWQKKMKDRKKQQGYISNLLQKPTDQLLMNQDDMYRVIQEKRKLIDRAIPAVDYGKGYRVGSEFWKQHESFGDDLNGIKMTLTKTERGSPVDFEHIGKPATIKEEVGATTAGQRPTVDLRRTWQSSHYLKQRSRQLETVMRELNPYNPDLSRIEVVGNVREEPSPRPGCGFEPGVLFEKIEPTCHDPLGMYPDTIPTPILGPSLLFGGKPAGWTGYSDNQKDQVGIVERVLFESRINERTISYLNLENNGTTAIYYEWRKKPKIPSFEDLSPDRVQRFYFNQGEGVILPNDITKLPFVFKSPNPGIFTETWELLTRPSLLGGAALQVTLKGIAQQDESSAKDRLKLEKELEKREASVCVKKIIEDLIKGIQTPDRPPSPIDAYVTEEELFVRKNPGRFYDHETVMELKNIYLQLFGEEDRDGKEWNLSLDELQDCVSAIPDEDAREELLSGLNTVIRRLSYPPLSPTQRKMHADCYRLLQETIDGVVSCSMMVRNIMGLPEIVMVETIQEPETQATGVAAPPKPDPKVLSAKSQLSQASSQGKGNDKKTAKGGKKGKDAKDDAKGKKGGKKNEKERPKSKDPKGRAGKLSAQSPTKELQLSERDISSKTPSTMRTAPTDSLDPVTRKKYTEKMYSQVYELLLETVDRMTLAFEETKLECGNENLN